MNAKEIEARAAQIEAERDKIDSLVEELAQKTAEMAEIVRQITLSQAALTAIQEVYVA